MCGFFTATPVTDFSTALTSDAGRYGRFFNGMLTRGIGLVITSYSIHYTKLYDYQSPGQSGNSGNIRHRVLERHTEYPVLGSI